MPNIPITDGFGLNLQAGQLEVRLREVLPAAPGVLGITTKSRLASRRPSSWISVEIYRSWIDL